MLAGLPAPQRHALEVALLRTLPTGSPPEPRAIAMGLLALLRSLAADGPLLVAMDDLQWLDAASAEALVFAARRLEDEVISFLLAKRPGRRAISNACSNAAPLPARVGPLGLPATGQLLLERLGLAVRRQLLRRIVDATRGNPLFALEVGRTFAEQTCACDR